MPIVISPKIAAKLTAKTPPVTLREIEQCFENRQGGLLMDTRENNKTDPPTLWFLARTNNNRLLKIVYVQRAESIFLKSAFEPNADEMRIYINHAC